MVALYPVRRDGRSDRLGGAGLCAPRTARPAAPAARPRAPESRLSAGLGSQPAGAAGRPLPGGILRSASAAKCRQASRSRFHVPSGRIGAAIACNAASRMAMRSACHWLLARHASRCCGSLTGCCAAARTSPAHPAPAGARHPPGSVCARPVQAACRVGPWCEGCTPTSADAAPA